MRRAPVWKSALALLAFLGLPALAAGGAGNLPRAPVEYGDMEAAQKGAAAFVNYCMGCHGMQHMRYGRLAEDLSISEAQIKSFLIYTENGLGDGMQTAMHEEDGREWFFQAAPPDLTLSARLRGPDWLYAYLRGFYRDPERPGGWNNAVFENAAMPHVLADLQGVYMRDGDTGEMVQISKGRMTPAEYDELAANLVAFMAYAGEPARAARFKIGYLVMAFLLALLLVTYFLYREYWKDVQ